MYSTSDSNKELLLILQSPRMLIIINTYTKLCIITYCIQQVVENNPIDIFQSCLVVSDISKLKLIAKIQ